MYNVQQLESLHNEIVRRDREKFLKREAKEIIKTLKKNKKLRIDRHIILIESCLKDLGRTLTYQQFDQILLEYRNETIHETIKTFHLP